MKRINVVGTSASGKTTFSKAIAEKLGLQHIELDDLFWQDNWQQSADEVFLAKLASQINQTTTGYVIDGNYSRSIPVKWREIDVVIWLDIPFHVNMWQSLKRAIKRAVTGRTLWPSSNNTESFGRMLSRDSIIWWMIKTHQKNRKKYLSMMEDPQYQHIRWIHLKSSRQAQQFLAAL
ncbi:shikimate kinase [Acinetobacter sp.]|uniref:shikimate kinase n=1 Tax=Acinetobacter sp. TaxID=472 RepID=UPI0028AAD18B|nr:shikimate kinase [Acinetobacter sp.]